MGGGGGGFIHSLVEIQLKRHKTRGHSFIVPCNAFCYLVIPYAILQCFV